MSAGACEAGDQPGRQALAAPLVGHRVPGTIIRPRLFRL